jgi:ABC-type arginine transport system ATPase subunit
MDTILDSITYEKMERSIELLEFIVKEIYKDFEVKKHTTLKERLIECNKKIIENDDDNDKKDITKIDNNYDEEEEENN